MDQSYLHNYSSAQINKRRHTLPTSFVDPAIVRYIERATVFDGCLLEDGSIEEGEEEEDEMDDQRTTITTVSLPQHLENSPKSVTNNATVKLNQLWARQYEELELRLLSLEVTKKRFERRLEELEGRSAFNNTIVLQQQQHQQQPMKPDQQPTTTTKTTTTRRVLQGNMIHGGDNRLTETQTHDREDDIGEVVMVTNQKYIELLNKHELLVNKHNATQIEFEEKEKHYKQKIQELSIENDKYKKELKQQKQEEEEEEEPSYKEEDGYLIFDTTNMNGEIIHCKVKIPTPSMALASPPATRVSSPQYQSPLTPLPSDHPSSTTTKKNKGLNFNAPEWKVNSNHS